MLDAEVHELPGVVEVGHEHQGRVVQPVGQVHQLDHVGQQPGFRSGAGRRHEGLQGVRAQLGEGLHLPDDGARQRFLRLGPGDLQDAVDPAARPGGHGDPGAVGVLAAADRGQSGPGERRQPLPVGLGQTAPGHGGHVGRDVVPAGRLARRETGAAREGQRAVGAGRPDRHGDRAQRAQGVIEQGVGHRLGVVRGQETALGGAQPYGGGLLDGPGRGRGDGQERLGDLRDAVPGRLVDHLHRELQRGHLRLLGEFGELAGGLGGAAAEAFDQDALGQFDQRPALRLGLRLSLIHGGGEPADRGGGGRVGRRRVGGGELGGHACRRARFVRVHRIGTPRPAVGRARCAVLVAVLMRGASAGHRR